MCEAESEKPLRFLTRWLVCLVVEEQTPGIQAVERVETDEIDFVVGSAVVGGVGVGVVEVERCREETLCCWCHF